MKLFTQTEYDQLIENGKPENRGKDHYPVVKLFFPGTGGNMVLTEIRNKKPLIAYGLFDMSSDCCKISEIDFVKIEDLAKKKGVEIKRAENFKAKSPISKFLKAAHNRRFVSDIESVLG